MSEAEDEARMKQMSQVTQQLRAMTYRPALGYKSRWKCPQGLLIELLGLILEKNITKKYGLV